MTKVRGTGADLVVTAHRGDAKTLIAFDLATEASRERLAGFTVQITPPGMPPYYLQNDLRFERPGDHAQVASESEFATINAPIHKFRWVHVPGTVHQGLKPAYGVYTYTVTPRYFDPKGSLRPLDPTLSLAVDVEVSPFAKGKFAVGFTRGFTQSQAFVRHFGRDALIRPKDAELQFDTAQVSGMNALGQKFTFADQYEWLGLTAREQIFALLQEVIDDNTQTVDVFAYDLNEPDIVGLLLRLGKAGRIRIILDNAALHHNLQKPTAEDKFAALFAQQADPARLKRVKFARYAHDKVFVVSEAGKPFKVLTGSTNFSVTGLYVNSNHVLVFENDAVAQSYADVFGEAWADRVNAPQFKKSKLSQQAFPFKSADIPATEITFSPHDTNFASAILQGLVDRVNKEAAAPEGEGSVLFAVMQLDGGTANPVYEALRALHESQTVFSFGISDSADGIELYRVGSNKGVLVTGKPINTQLPPPFNQVPNIGGIGHQVHHKFVVAGFNGEDPVVYCGSSNLALGGEQENGDNLLAIRDADVVTVFAIEALALVDHFNFLDSTAKGPKSTSQVATPMAAKPQAAVSAGWFLGTDDTWVHKFFDPHDLHFKDRELFSR